MEKHYVCTGGCGGVSDTPGTCQTKECPGHDDQLKDCDCADGSHQNKQKEKGEGPEKESDGSGETRP